MAITNLPTQPMMSDAEWETRCDLAALYHIFHHLRMTDLIYTHMTARIPGEKDTFLINNYGGDVRRGNSIFVSQNGF